jgi:Pyridine nucleotide-disulphide oxidoreductase, dimerisation domain
MHEHEIKARSIPARVARIPMAVVLRTHTLSQTRGFAKALIGAYDRILSFTAFGAEASEMMAVVQTAMVGGLLYTTLRDTIFYPPDRRRRAGRSVLGHSRGVGGGEPAHARRSSRTSVPFAMTTTLAMPRNNPCSTMPGVSLSRRARAGGSGMQPNRQSRMW